jgi:16S rRNA (cytosine967-C5)-methyltransferase
LLNPQPGERVLDACAAPGGKTAHLLELAPTIDLLAVDADAQRLQRVSSYLSRTGGHAQLLACDAGNLPTSLAAFDAILLDAPCSATGVIRRHPDIAWLRRASDVSQVLPQQARLLDALWQRLKSGGRLLYATCSILPEENALQIAQFLARTADASAAPWPTQWAWFGVPAGVGRQNFPGQQGMDGFFYALLMKR